jgi:hypothetical protein
VLMTSWMRAAMEAEKQQMKQDERHAAELAVMGAKGVNGQKA